MTVNVLNQWLESGASGFTDITQAILATQNTQLSTQIGAFSPNQAFVSAVVDAIEQSACRNSAADAITRWRRARPYRFGPRSDTRAVLNACVPVLRGPAGLKLCEGAQ